MESGTSKRETQLVASPEVAMAVGEVQVRCCPMCRLHGYRDVERVAVAQVYSGVMTSQRQRPVTMATTCSTRRHTMTSLVLTLLATLLTTRHLPHPAAAIKLLPVHWNSTNTMFRLDNTDHVLDVSIGDVIDVVCPQYPRNTPQYMIEQHVLYQVTREEYESCRILHEDNRVTRQVLKCTKPYELQKLTIVFREYTPVPNGLEYVRGQDYYYISTSSGYISGLYNRDGGACRWQNMKMIFKICCNNEVYVGNDVSTYYQSSSDKHQHLTANLQTSSIGDEHPVMERLQTTSTSPHCTTSPTTTLILISSTVIITYCHPHLHSN